MKTFDYPLKELQTDYDLSLLAPVERILFLDIETTGFSPREATVYLIGVCFQKGGVWRAKQWFAEKEGEEGRILKEFFQFAGSYGLLIHFNGSGFDLPFLRERINRLGLGFSLEGFEGIDLYRQIAPYRKGLRLNSLKQKALEGLLGLKRQDAYSGGELIPLYRQYARMPDPEGLETLLAHNREDVEGLLGLTPLLAYHDLFHRPLTLDRVSANHYRDYQGAARQEVILRLTFASALPLPLSLAREGCYFAGEGREGSLRIPLYTEEMKHFYNDYQNYYYLPEEDMALHKSVAAFVEKSHRRQASAATCYTRKHSSYLPQWKVLAEPFFKRDYADRSLFFEWTREKERDRELFTRYAAHVLERLA